MRIKKAKVQDFKYIIDSGGINLDDELTAFIGKNEQGKTSFLKALTTIDDKYLYKTADLNYRLNIDSKQKEIPFITLWFGLDDNDKKFLENLDIDIGNHEIIKIIKYFDNSYDIYLDDSLLETNKIKNPTLKGGVCYGPHYGPQSRFSCIQKSSNLRCPGFLDIHN
jgi:predicted ATP-dependent endonuclease of OLD family